ncbi:hypothetical protein [Sphingosinicella humi]|uniref:UDP-3-O-(3-hydroxymyristoyl)glucosamine N-acyltransferase n=1 Tax=Allosphingosinicella humi TaxID=2068657 RepID=A0A2U2J169_9SPHN|nr:hypothetical protein [Sphingosinicella humi]PWG02090.1 hypothetical protein DF286_03825 [Sphingosinicella humi]
MFNIDKRARLREFATYFDEIARDIDFYTIGKVPTRVECRLVPITDRRHIREAASCSGIVGFICPADLVDDVPPDVGCAISSDPIAAAYYVHRELCGRSGYFWSDFDTVIAPDAFVHPRAYIDPRNVRIGPGSWVGPNAVVQERSIIGSGCRIGAGTVIGSEAYEIAPIGGRNRLQAHAGGVWIGNNVVFCSNSAVARSIYPVFTRIGDDCSFDNLVHVAHDCELEAGCKMTACSMLSGRVDLAAGAYLGPNSTVSNGLQIGEKSVVTIGATVVRNVRNGARVTGNFAIDHDKFIRNLKATVR